MNIKAYSPQTAGEVLEVSSQSILKFINEGQLKAYKIGRQWRILEVDLLEFVQNQPSNIEDIDSSVTADLGSDSGDSE